LREALDRSIQFGEGVAKKQSLDVLHDERSRASFAHEPKKMSEKCPTGIGLVPMTDRAETLTRRAAEYEIDLAASRVGQVAASRFGEVGEDELRTRKILCERGRKNRIFVKCRNDL
jgi:hypothetical protein